MLKILLFAAALVFSVSAADAAEKPMPRHEQITLEKVKLLVTQKEVLNALTKFTENTETRCSGILDAAIKKSCIKGFGAVKDLYHAMLEQIDAMLASLDMPEGTPKSYLLGNAFNPDEFNALLGVSQRQLNALKTIFVVPTRQLGALETK